MALGSITLMRDEGDLLPLTPETSILVIYPAGGSGLGQAVLEYAPQARLFEVSKRPTSGEFVQAVDAVVIGTHNVKQWSEQADLVKGVEQQRPVIAVALDSPFDLLSYPDVSTNLASYGRAPFSMEALAQVLFGMEVPSSRLPVELPRLYPVGHR